MEYRTFSAELLVQQRAFSWNSPFVVFTVVFCVVLATSVLVSRTLLPGGRARKNVAQAPQTPTRLSNWQGIARAGHVAGNAAAPVTVVLFADYQCPGCAALHNSLRAANDSFPGALRIISRHFPLSGHIHARQAANAAECAAAQGRFTAFEDVAYSHQDSIGNTGWVAFALRAGVRDTTEFAKCLRQLRYDAAVTRDRSIADSLKLVGTPVYVVNGTSYFGAPTDSAFIRQLRDALRAATPVVAASAVESIGVHASASQGTTPDVTRRWLPPLQLERSIVGATDDELLMPGSLAATNENQVVLFDFGSMEVRAFSVNGRQVWRTGRKGSGPGEFRNAMDVKLRSNGELAVLDMSNRRITTLSANGHVTRTIPVTRNSSRFVPLPDSAWFALAGDDSSTLWFGVNARGDTTTHMPSPNELVPHHALAREMFTAPMANGAAVAFRWSDKVALLREDGSVRRVLSGIETVPFPLAKSYPLKVGKFKGQVFRVDPQATPGALAITTQGEEIFVLFAGATQNRGRIIDIYNSSTGNYEGSRLLPLPALEIVALPSGGFATLRSEPVPTLDIWRGVSSKGPR